MSNSPHPNLGILIADPDETWARELAESLRAAGYAPEVATGVVRLRQLLSERSFAAAVCDQDAALLDEIARALASPAAPALILLSDVASIRDAVEALRAGASDYLCKPVAPDQVRAAVARALTSPKPARAGDPRRASPRSAEHARERTVTRRHELGPILSTDPQFERVFETVDALAETRATVLIEGESGTGKTLLARTIHQRSSRATAPFIEVNCGALPQTLLESELFGHVRGSFTGAVNDKAGKFEAAHTGTLFLDEIGTASLDLQVKLLRVLQDRTFERVGDTKTREADVRVIAATNRDLAAEVAAGRFREDLYYRIHVVSLRLPSLRERPADIPLLSEHFVERFSAEYGRPARRLSSAAIATLARHTWPGNVRELEHCLERAVLLGQGPQLEPADLGPALQDLRASKPSGPLVLAAPSAPPGGMASPPQPDGSGDRPSRDTERGAPRPGLSLREALEEPEREIIRRTLELNGGNRKATARMLDVNRTTLFNKMRKYNLMEFPIRAESQPGGSPTSP